jgi:hypothetical protein
MTVHMRAPMHSSRIEQARGLMFDEETGAVLWPLLIDRTEIALARARRDEKLVAVFAFDNPRVEGGAPANYAELRERLACLLRPDDTIGRVAGRCFVVVCNEIREDQDAATIAQRLLQNVAVVENVGIAIGAPTDDAESLVRHAIEDARS